MTLSMLQNTKRHRDTGGGAPIHEGVCAGDGIINRQPSGVPQSVSVGGQLSALQQQCSDACTPQKL